MRSRTIAAIVAVSLLTLTGHAAAANTQQDKMKSCNAEATQKSLSGDARKAFMKTCLSGGSAAANTQQEKMKSCNAEATTKKLKGTDRKTFMKTCLSTKS